MLGVILAVILAIVVYWLCSLAGLPIILCVIAALLVLLFGIGLPAYGRRGL
jgi:hypothetical protein